MNGNVLGTARVSNKPLLTCLSIFTPSPTKTKQDYPSSNYPSKLSLHIVPSIYDPASLPLPDLIYILFPSIPTLLNLSSFPKQTHQHTRPYTIFIHSTTSVYVNPPNLLTHSLSSPLYMLSLTLCPPSVLAKWLSSSPLPPTTQLSLPSHLISYPLFFIFPSICIHLQQAGAHLPSHLCNDNNAILIYPHSFITSHASPLLSSPPRLSTLQYTTSTL